MTHTTRNEHVVHSPYMCPTARRARRLTWRIGAALLLAAPAAAQHKPAGAVAGVVKDSAGAPIANVEVTAVKLAHSVRTDSAGEFTVGGLLPGPTDFRFRRLAYEPVVLVVQVPADDTTDVEVTLGLVAQQLTGVVVQASAQRLRMLEAFEARRKHGIGHFITRAQINERDPIRLSDMVRLIPGATIFESNGRTALRFSRVSNKACPPQFFIDGIQAMGFSIDDMPPGDVEGVELYAGAAGVPPQYNRFNGTSICGTILIWTRIPGKENEKS